jgi:hypothetical protein
MLQQLKDMRNRAMSFAFAPQITVDGSGYLYPGGAAEYERQLKAIQANVLATKTGAAVVSFFTLRKKEVFIRPWEEETPHTPSKSNAGAGAHQRPQATRRGMPVAVDKRGRPVHARGSGIGGGSDSTIFITPIHFSDRPDHPADAVLVHEMMHSVRQTFGFQWARNVGHGFHDIEEIYAVFVENMYRFERGYSLRSSHSGEPIVRSPDHSMKANKWLHGPMRDFAGVMPSIANSLARVLIPYNPFKDWLQYVAERPDAGKGMWKGLDDA